MGTKGSWRIYFDRECGGSHRGWAAGIVARLDNRLCFCWERSRRVRVEGWYCGEISHCWVSQIGLVASQAGEESVSRLGKRYRDGFYGEDPTLGRARVGECG